MPELPDGPSAAEMMAANLAEFEPAVAADDLVASPMDEFMAAFNPEPPAAEDPPADVAPAPVDPPATDADDTDIEPAVKLSPKAKESWDVLRGKAKEYKVKAAELERTKAEEIKARDTELETLRQQLAEVPDLRERAKVADENEKELAVARVEGTKMYKDTILAPLDAIGEAVNSIAEANSVNADTLFDAISERDPAKRRDMIEEVLSGLRETDKLELVGMARDTQQLLAKRDQIRENAFEAKKELEARESEALTTSQRKAKEAYQSSVDHAVEELRKRVPFVAISEGETADAVFSLLHGKAKESDFDAATPSVKAFSAVAGVMLPRVTKQLTHALDKIKKLEARIAEGNTSLPTVGRGNPAPAPVGDDDDFMAGISKALKLPYSRPNLG